MATIKNHAFMGVTGCLKNLFGLMPTEPHARPRTYYHHLVRMPGMLADIGRILDPALNIVDALVGQAGQEWSAYEPTDGRIVDALIAGDHVIATDAAMMHLMGHDPRADWTVATVPSRPQPAAGCSRRWLRHGRPGRDRLPYRGRATIGRELSTPS